jgi:hypothetical protein
MREHIVVNGPRTGGHVRSTRVAYDRALLWVFALAIAAGSLCATNVAHALNCDVTSSMDNALMPPAGSLRRCVNLTTADTITFLVAGVSLVDEIRVTRPIRFVGNGAQIFQDIGASPGFNEFFDVLGTDDTVTFERLLFLGYGSEHAITVRGTRNTVSLVLSELSGFGAFATGTRHDATIRVAGSSCSLRVVGTKFMANTMLRGGAIYGLAGSTVSIDSSSRFEANIGADGGAIAMQQSSTLSVIDASFAYNGGTVGPGNISNAGAIHLGTAVDTTIAGATFEGNQGDFAGAVFCSRCNLVASGTFIRNRNPSSGMTVGGGAITVAGDGEVELLESVFEGNSAEGVGGAIRLDNVHDTVVRDSFFHENRGALGGGGISIEGSPASRIVVERCSFEQNTIDEGRPGQPHYGGGIMIEEAEAEVTNCAFHYNGEISGGPQAFGGSIAVLTNAHAVLRHITATEGNAADGGNLAIVNASAELLNSILAYGGGNDCFQSPVALTAFGSFDSDGSCGLDPGQNSPSTDPEMDAYGDYGQTLPGHVLRIGSKAVDAGNPTYCVSDDLNGAPRTSACDIGAVESF